MPKTAAEIPAPKPRSGPKVQTFRALRHRDFLLLWLSNLANASANWFQQVTIPWVVWELSNSPFWVGVSAGMRSLPFLFIGPLAGVWADRVDRRKLVLIVQSLLAAAVLSFAFGIQRGYVAGGIGVFYAVVFAGISGALQAMIQPVRQAMVANTVPRADLWNAIALNSIAGNVARVVGPGVGGALILLVGPAMNFYIQGALCVVMAVMVAPMALPYREEITARRHSVGANLAQGFQHVFRDRRLLRLVTLSYIPALFGASVIQIMPVIADEVLKGNSATFGLLITAIGVGGIIGTIMVASVAGFLRGGAVGIVALALLSACTLALGLSTWLAVSLAAMFGFGFFRMLFQVNNNTLIQSAIPDAMRGRIMAIYHLDNGFTPLASMLVGLMAEFMPPNLVVTLVGATSLCLALYAFLVYKDVRQMR